MFGTAECVAAIMHGSAATLLLSSARAAAPVAELRDCDIDRMDAMARATTVGETLTGLCNTMHVELQLVEGQSEEGHAFNTLYGGMAVLARFIVASVDDDEEEDDDGDDDDDDDDDEAAAIAEPHHVAVVTKTQRASYIPSSLVRVLTGKPPVPSASCAPVTSMQGPGLLSSVRPDSKPVAFTFDLSAPTFVPSYMRN